MTNTSTLRPPTYPQPAYAPLGRAHQLRAEQRAEVRPPRGTRRPRRIARRRAQRIGTAYATTLSS